jgi:hypothetical protein
MFHCFIIPYFTCNIFTKFTYNEYIGPYFLSHVVLRFSPSDLPGSRCYVEPLCYVFMFMWKPLALTLIFLCSFILVPQSWKQTMPILLWSLIIVH